MPRILLSTRFDFLAQISLPMLESPPGWEVWLFESPWWPAVFLLTGSVLAFWLCNNAGKTRQGLQLLLVGLFIAAALITTATLVTTTRELLAQQTKKLVKAAAQADLHTLEQLLVNDAEVHLRGEAAVISKDKILAAVRATTGSMYPVSDPAIIRLQAQVDSRNPAFTQAWTRVTYADAPVRSWWRLTWRREQLGDDPSKVVWRVSVMDMLQLDAVSDPRSLRTIPQGP